MRSTGFLKLHRELYNKPIWIESTPQQKVILITLLGMANYQKNTWVFNDRTYNVKPGQFITSIPSIIKACGKGITEQNVRTALKRFEKLGFLTDTPVIQNTNRLITIINWDTYQKTNNKILTNELTNDLTDELTDDKTHKPLDIKVVKGSTEIYLTDGLTEELTEQLNPIKEVREIKNNNMTIQQAELFNSWWNLYSKKIGRKKCETQFRKLLKKYEYPVIEEGTKRYLQYLNNLSDRREFVPSQKNPLTFLNGEHFNDEYESNPVNQELNGQSKTVTIDEFSGIRLD